MSLHLVHYIIWKNVIFWTLQLPNSLHLNVCRWAIPINSEHYLAIQFNMARYTERLFNFPPASKWQRFCGSFYRNGQTS